MQGPLYIFRSRRRRCFFVRGKGLCSFFLRSECNRNNCLQSVLFFFAYFFISHYSFVRYIINKVYKHKKSYDRRPRAESLIIYSR